MNRLKEFREEAMMTVRELSERSGVSEDTITKIENGHRKGRGMTLRKLAKALGTKPYQLFPEDFERSTGAEESALETLPQDELFDTDTASTRSPEADTQGAPAQAGIHRALEVVKEVEEQSGLGAQAHLKFLTEGQRDALLAVARGGAALSPSAVAEQLGCSVSTAYRDLTILGEYGLVSRNESGGSQATPLGTGVAGILAGGGLHFDEALMHIATLTKAYEPVRRVEQHELDEVEAWLYFWLQESVVHLIRDIVGAAEPSPLARQVRENRWASGPTREGVKDSAALVLSVMRNLTSKPPRIPVIRADIEGVPEERIYEALDAVSAAFRSGKGTSDPYKNFVWNLKKPNRIRRYPTTQQGEIDSSQQASARRSDS